MGSYFKNKLTDLECKKNLNALSIKILSIWRMVGCDSELRKIQKHGYTDLG